MDLSNSGFLAHNFDLLGAIFHEKGMPKGDHHEMSKDDFIAMLKDSDLLIIPKIKISLGILTNAIACVLGGYIEAFLFI